MKIAVLSGKGGTGKTTVTANLAANLSKCIAIDADVEEPNLNIFLRSKIDSKLEIKTEYPWINPEKCNLCGKCGDFCNYNAIIPTKNKVLVFKESCHGCGGCKVVCPTGAIEYKKREIGGIYSSSLDSEVPMKYGQLNIGEISGVKIIKKIKDLAEDEATVIIDSPPGTSCATVAAVEGVDYAIVVSEPTPFGVSDMKMVVEMLRNLKIPFGIVVNKAGLGDNEIYEYCESESIDILEEIPYSIKIAELYADGVIFSKKIKGYEEVFLKLFQKIKLKIEAVKEIRQ